MTTIRRKPLVRGYLKIELLVASVLGLGALVVVVVLAFSGVPLDTFRQNILWTLLAFGVAGASVFIPGLIEVQVPNFAKAAGALGIFVLIFSQSPGGKKIADVVFSQGNPQEAIDAFFKAVDKNDYVLAWDLTSDWSKRAYPKDTFLNVFENEHKPYGQVIKRIESGIQSAENPSGLPSGAYRTYIYRTTFSNNINQLTKETVEAITLGYSDGSWKIFNYNIAPFRL